MMETRTLQHSVSVSCIQHTFLQDSFYYVKIYLNLFLKGGGGIFFHLEFPHNFWKAKYKASLSKVLNTNSDIENMTKTDQSSEGHNKDCQNQIVYKIKNK